MTNIKKTPLYELHDRLGAKFVPFAGYKMPVQYSTGVMKEHLHTRSSAGLFDVSHMGQIKVSSKRGDAVGLLNCLEELMPCDLRFLSKDRQCYSFFTNDRGGLSDDLMIANRGSHFLIIVNASRKLDDFSHLEKKIGDRCQIELLADRSLLALQGPLASKVLEKYNSSFARMFFLDVKTITLLGVECWVSRSGYTGEDGFELSIPSEDVKRIAEEFLTHEDVLPIGLGARDSLRLEAGLCLYGNDLDEITTPIEANLNWAVHKVRRIGGEREGGFIGDQIILGQLASGTDIKRVALLPKERAPIREGCALFETAESTSSVGHVTSGGFSPTLQKPISLAYIKSDLATKNNELFAEVRGKRMGVTVTTLPFVKTKYKIKTKE
ncbi:MAG: glycine cleavage system aminomethyltransferase GcvT [Paracoccaceae bacterium]|nr:glycine cleavage system aminomethyltransferase GcvT [Paracoccaceae bacterium]